MTLNLVHSWHHLGRLQQIVGLGDGEVGYSDGFGKTLGLDSLHTLVCRERKDTVRSPTRYMAAMCRGASSLCLYHHSLAKAYVHKSIHDGVRQASDPWTVAVSSLLALICGMAAVQNF